MKRISALLAAVILILMSGTAVYAEGNSAEASGGMEIDARSAIVMDAQTGTVLFEKNADEALPPASVTKVMTLLLVMEAVDAGTLTMETIVPVSENAASMGGSQVYLKVGEEMTAADMIKSVVISSANDAAVALAEYVAGSEEAFVARMNERAAELGMVNTHFENTNGLDDDVENHVTSARDIAIMSRELLRHEKIMEYSMTWMDSIRNGAFGLTNTNRLVRFYKGATGLKTGSTSKAKFCISATAKRENLHLIAVIMGAPTRDVRNDAAKKLLDWGFANYALYQRTEAEAGTIDVLGGIRNLCALKSGSFEMILSKGDEKKITEEVILNENIAAPVTEGQKVGTILLKMDGAEIGSVDICAAESVDKISYFGLLQKMFAYFSLKPAPADSSLDSGGG